PVLFLPFLSCHLRDLPSFPTRRSSDLVGRVLEVHEIHDATDLWEVRALPDRRAGGEVAVPPLRDLGGWSSVNAGTATTYVRSLPLPDGGGVAVLRLRRLAEHVHVAVDHGPERLAMPGAAVIVLEPAEGGGEGGGQVEVAVRAPHLPGGLLDRVELLHARAPRLLDLRTVREAELAELLTEHARTADAVGRHPLPGPSTRPARTERGETAAADPAGGSPAGLPIDAGAPVLIRLAAE